MSEYIISEKALEDINNIWIYNAENWSFEQADRYYNAIIDEIEFIVQKFELASDFGKIRKSYKYSKVKSHLIFFKKNISNEIEVVRVLHERMAIEHRLNE
ncbi:type II toxin-antitoxin system RelE/ParE family toxin [Flavobacterium sp. DSR2-3-3]|uniref:type II toxin-antitoxin system RelE/ParE family toxin n=1 Tax=Flavobacterium sp. DSR2-3-3 TaxID=2804632 RepID=UPI003CF4A183